MNAATKELRLFLCDHLQAATNEWGRRKDFSRKSVMRAESEARFDQAVRMLDELDRLIALEATEAPSENPGCDECGVHDADFREGGRPICQTCYDMIIEAGNDVGDVTPLHEQEAA